MRKEYFFLDILRVCFVYLSNSLLKDLNDLYSTHVHLAVETTWTDIRCILDQRWFIFHIFDF